MNKKIVIAGGTGFVGKYLSNRFGKAGYEVIIISRQPGHVHWDNEAAVNEALEGAEMLINLAGKSVDCRYNEQNRKAIFDSRINTTRMLGNALLNCANPPQVWINSSTATIYRHAQDRPMTESAGETGTGFSVHVATNWEKAFFDFRLPRTRQLALRMAIVLGRDGGVMKPLKNLVRTGLGGKQGNGEQMFSWIHIEDLYRVVVFLQQHDELSGVFNASSPYPVKNKELMQLMRKHMGIPVGLPMPVWLLRMGAVFIRTETELVLKSRWVIPEKLLQAGFEFKYPLPEEAIKNVLTDES